VSTKRVLDVGNCVPDHAAIKTMIESNFDATVDRSHLATDTFAALQSEPYDLILVNRKLDHDYSDGMEILKQLKADPNTKTVPVMLVTNYAQHQQAAVDAGAEWGFGKLELWNEETQQRLRPILGNQPVKND
jgi:CheY-like chemotaxis protein